MSRAQFDSTENAQLRAKIDQAKRRLPLPDLMRELGHQEKRRTARCPFHSDEHPSFSVFHSSDGKGWQWKCHAGCGHGDEIDFLAKHFNISRRAAIKRYLDMAGFAPVSRNGASKSHECPESPECPECRLSPRSRESPESPVFPVHPVSNGQGLDEEREKVLRQLAARNACTERNTARKRLWKLLRDLRAVEKGSGRKLNLDQRKLVFEEWYRLSQPFLDPKKTRDDYFAAFLAQLPKVRVTTGEGNTLNKAFDAVSKLSGYELPEIPGMPNAPESWRRLAALHRELSRLTGAKTYFLTYRDAAKACPGLSHQTAHNITLALALPELEVIKIVHKGKAGLNSGEAAEFRYLLPRAEFPGEKDDEDECPF
jgi:CHC2 zinc finger